MSSWERNRIPALMAARIRAADRILLITREEDASIYEPLRAMAHAGSVDVHCFESSAQISLRWSVIHRSVNSMPPLYRAMNNYDRVICVIPLQCDQLPQFLPTWVNFHSQVRRSGSTIVVEMCRNYYGEFWLDVAERYRESAFRCGFRLTAVNGVESICRPQHRNFVAAMSRIRWLQQQLPRFHPSGISYGSAHGVLRSHARRHNAYYIESLMRAQTVRPVRWRWVMDRIVGMEERLFATLQKME